MWEKYKCDKCGNGEFIAKGIGKDSFKRYGTLDGNGDFEGDGETFDNSVEETTYFDAVQCSECRKMFSRSVIAGKEPVDRDQILGMARDMYQSEECQVYDDAKIDDSPEYGYWVEARLWIPKDGE